MKLVKACIALAAFAALFVVPSIASASPELTHPTGVTYTGNIIATNVAHATTSKNTVMTASPNVECAVATLTGEVTSNTGTHIAGNITTASFEGRPGETTTGACSGGSLGSVTVTPSHTSDFEHEYEAGKKSKSLPWCITATGSKHEFSVRGGKCSEAARPLMFALHSLCGTSVYKAAEVKGTYTTHPADAVLTINKQPFTRVTGSAFCPATGELDMAFTLTTDLEGGKKEGEPLYIS